MASEEDVRRICLSLPETIEKPYERLPGFRVKGKLFARIRENPYALVVMRPDVLDKEALIASEPEKFFQAPHYEGHPAVLVRLEAVDLDELEELAADACGLNLYGYAATLWGAAERHREEMGSQMPPVAVERLSQYISHARAALGGAQFQTAWAAGRAMTLEQAVTYALEDSS